MTEPVSILLSCLKCRQRYVAGSVQALLTRRCLCGGRLVAI